MQTSKKSSHSHSRSLSLSVTEALFSLQELSSENLQRNRGVVITGGVGSGKTAILEQLLEQSAFETGACGLVSSGTYVCASQMSH